MRWHLVTIRAKDHISSSCQNLPHFRWLPWLSIVQYPSLTGAARPPRSKCLASSIFCTRPSPYHHRCAAVSLSGVYRKERRSSSTTHWQNTDLLPGSEKQHLIHPKCPTLAGRKLRPRSKHNETLLSLQNGDLIRQSTEAGTTSSAYLMSAVSYRTDRSRLPRIMMPLTFLLASRRVLSLLKKS